MLLLNLLLIPLNLLLILLNLLLIPLNLLLILLNLSLIPLNLFLILLNLLLIPLNLLLILLNLLLIPQKFKLKELNIMQPGKRQLQQLRKPTINCLYHPMGPYSMHHQLLIEALFSMERWRMEPQIAMDLQSPM